MWFGATRLIETGSPMTPDDRLAEYVIENAEDFADERGKSVEWIVENAEDVADELRAAEEE